MRRKKNQPLQRNKEMVLSDLPEELQVDIFLKLPVNSIVSCSRVCKIWRTLISSHKFIKAHLENGISNPKLMIQSYNIHYLKRLFRSIDYESISSDLSTSSTTCTCDVDMLHSSTRMLGSGNGLICMALNWEEVSHICIWNPSTSESRIAPLPSNDFFSSEKHCGLGYVFYYDCVADDYKLVRIAGIRKYGISYFPSGNISGEYQVDCFTLGSKSWKSRRTTESTNRYVFPSDIRSLISAFFVNGSLYWIGTKNNNGFNSRVVVSFNVTSERFRDLFFPIANIGVTSCFGVLEDRLSLGTYHNKIHQIDIWLMQDYGGGEPWIKTYSFSTTNMTLYREWKLLWSFTNSELLIYNGSNKLYLCDPKKDRFRDLKIDGMDDFVILNSVSLNYVGSLLSPNSIGC